MSKKLTSHDIAKMIDHSLLHPTLGDAQLKEGCELARKYDVGSCCVKPYHVKMTADLLKGSTVKVCSVVGFPHGNSTTKIKVLETEQAIADGATEIDLVCNIARVLEGKWDYVEKEIGEVTALCKKNGAVVKLIYEADYLNDEQIAKLSQVCNRTGVKWLKTSTGYNYKTDKNGQLYYDGASDRVLKIMHDNAGPGVEVKAAGKCRDLARFIEVREKYGVTRVGTGQTAQVVEEARVKLDGVAPAGKVAANKDAY
jgi:deoxyribose-phosphate aldolase